MSAPVALCVCPDACLSKRLCVPDGYETVFTPETQRLTKTDNQTNTQAEEQRLNREAKTETSSETETYTETYTDTE